MFSHAVDLGPQGQNIRNDTGFMYQYHQNGMAAPTTAKGRYPQGPFWHPGYAWAARLIALDKLPGPLFDRGILGSSDPALRARINAFQEELAESVRAKDAALQERQGKVTGQ